MHLGRDAAPADKNYHPALDGVRFFCIILTVIYHVPNMPSYFNGRMGVDIFFALSGWLITWLLVSEKAKQGSINLKAFYVRRIFRIVPLYVVTILLYVAAAFVSARLMPTTEHLSNMYSALPYLVTFNSEYRPVDAGNFLGHAWTLGIEEKFYLAWPLAMVVVRPLRIGLLILYAVVILASMKLGANPDSLVRGYLGLTFGTVCALCAMKSSKVQGFLSSSYVQYAGLTAIVICYCVSLRFPDSSIPCVAISAAAAPFIGSLWLNPRGPIANVLSFKPIAALGRLTYGLYLVHVLVINVVVILATRLHLPQAWPLILVLSYAGAVLTAFALHVAVESPLINKGRGIARRLRTPGAEMKSATEPAV